MSTLTYLPTVTAGFAVRQERSQGLQKGEEYRPHHLQTEQLSMSTLPTHPLHQHGAWCPHLPCKRGRLLPDSQHCFEGLKRRQTRPLPPSSLPRLGSGTQKKIRVMHGLGAGAKLTFTVSALEVSGLVSAELQRLLQKKTKKSRLKPPKACVHPIPCNSG